MSEKDFFIKRMEAEFPVTLKVLKAIPADQGDFTPHPRSGTAKRIVETMVAELAGMQKMVEGAENIFAPVETPSLADAIASYEKVFAETIEKVKNASDEETGKPLQGMMGKFLPRVMDGLFAFLFDTIHHRGQLSVYVRLAGGKVPAIYGSSADENPFAAQ